MKKKLISGMLIALLAALLLSACGSPAVFNVSSNEDNTVSVTAERGPKGSAGLGYLSVGEGGSVVVETHFKGDGKIEVSLFAGLLGSESFPDEASYEIVASGEGRAVAGVEAGEYTVAVKAANTVTGTALLSVEGGEPPVESAEADLVGMADDSLTLGDVALRPDGEAGLLHQNGGYTLFIPLEYEEQLLVEAPENAPDGLLFSVTEKASLAAAGDVPGAGWLFGIRKISEEEMAELKSQDIPGVELFARDGDGSCFVFTHPTDVRYFREDNEAMARDQEIWNTLSSWAWNSVRESFLSENSGLIAVE